MRTRRTIKTAVLILLSLVGLVVLGSVASASGLINAINPNTSEVDNAPVIVPPLLAPPPKAETYTSHPDIALPITSPDKRPIAQLASPIWEGVESIRVYIPDIVKLNDIATGTYEVYYQVLASVEYKSKEDVFLVTTSQPSPQASQHPTVFGDQETQLSDGTTAWVTSGLPGVLPNRVVFLKNNLAITMVGDLPLKELQILALQVVVP